MIEKIVIDTKKHLFEPVEKINERLNYFKQISANGLDNLTDSEWDRVYKEFDRFLNINLTLFADTEPTHLFRITVNKRIYKENPYKLQKLSDLIGPPAELSKIGRANRKGDSVFYAALDFNTAVWEMQPEKGDYITVSEWKIKSGQKLTTHFIFHPVETNPSKESQNAFNAHSGQFINLRADYKDTFTSIIQFVAEEFMKPVDRSKGKNYLFSSLFSSRFLQEAEDANGFKIDSISYPSTRRDHEVTNIAILNSLVFEKLDLISVKIMTVGETNYDLKNKTREDLILVSQLVTEAEHFEFENNRIHWNLKKELEDAMKIHVETNSSTQQK